MVVITWDLGFEYKILYSFGSMEFENFFGQAIYG